MFDDNIYEDALNGEDDLLNQPIEAGDENNFEEIGDPGAAGERVEVKIKRRRDVIRPIDRFMGDRGLQSVGEYYKGIKYKGKGHETEDINAIMSRMQHWAHRAFPKMKFDDALTVVEGLTKKRIIQTHMNKYRMDMLQPAIIPSDDQVEDEPGLEGVQPMDEFDDMLGDQIEQMTKVQNRIAHSTALNNTSMMNQSDCSLGVSAIPHTPVQVRQAPQATAAALTSDQMAKIAENRLKALERLKQKQLEAQQAERTRDEMDESVSLED